jgi:long-chain acyl-CoA synthetase
MNYEDIIRERPHNDIDLDALESLVTDADILNLQFTSGSTGLPKTAALTHHGMLNSARYIGMKMKIKQGDVINIPVPLFHAFGLVIGMRLLDIYNGVQTTDTYTGLCAAMAYGASIVLPSELYDTEETLRSIALYRCTALYGVTTMFVDMLCHPTFDTTDRSSLRYDSLQSSPMTITVTNYYVDSA